MPIIENAKAPSESEDSSLVVYRLGALADMGLAPVIVAGFGNPMKAAVKACDKCMDGPVYVTGTEDKRRAFCCAKRAEVVTIGEKFDKRLFGNAHAVVQAALECSARCILLADPEQSDSALLRSVCAGKGILLLAPMKGDKSLGFWVSLEAGPEGPDGDPDWRACPHCKMFHDARAVMRDWGRCPTCGAYYRLTSDERIAMTFDRGSFCEWDRDIPERNAMGFPGFDGYIERARSGGYRESVRTGRARIGGFPVAAGIMEPSFMMGSLGYVAGERLASMFERATEEGLPAIVFTSSGGARMQEGLSSLMQMAKVSVAIEQHSRAGLLFVSVLCDPTTGGVTASFAMQGDIVVAEPGALIGFAGRRVVQGTIKQELPDDFQTAEFALKHGLIDDIVARSEMRERLGMLLALHEGADRADGSHEVGDDALHEVAAADDADSFEEPASQEAPFVAHEEIPGYLCIEDVGAAERGSGSSNSPATLLARSASALGALGERIVGTPGPYGRVRTMAARMPEAEAATADGTVDGKRAAKRRAGASEDVPAGSAWHEVQVARNTHRPTSRFYIDSMVDGFVELHGDRASGDDGAIVGGIGWIDGMPVTVIAEEKGADLKERIARGFGSPMPSGYRKSRRLMQQAQKFNRPVVCLVDTQGAFCGVEAEETGQGNAIAESLLELAGLTVPVVSVIVGEGGSGGALALALANRVGMQEHAVYSVLSPEGFASILWKDAARAPEAADVMKMSAADAFEMGVVDCVLAEGAGPAHENSAEAARVVGDYVRTSLRELSALGPDELRAERYRRFREL